MGTPQLAHNPRKTLWDAASTLQSRVAKWSSSAGGSVVLHGTGWTIVSYLCTQLLRVASTLILARHFFGPEPFGLVGLVGVFLAGLAMFSELGIVTSIVQHPRAEEPAFLDTAFSIQAGRGAAIWIVSLVAAYPFAMFYGQPQLLPLLAAAGMSELLRGLTSTSTWLLNRHVKLRDITLLSIASEVVAFIVSVTWAIQSPSAWALVVRSLVAAAIYAVGSHWIAKPRVRFGWDWPAARDILRFGGWVSLGTATYFLGSQGERLIIGKFVTAAELGCFSLALMLVSVPGSGVTQLANQVFLPILSKAVRNSREAATQAFRRGRIIFVAIAGVAALGCLVLGKPVVALALDDKYQMTGWMVQILGLRLAMDIFAAPASNLILASGESRYSAAGNTTRLILMAAGVTVALAGFGIREALMALVVAQAGSYLPLLLGLRRILPEVAPAEARWYGLLIVLLTLVGIAANLQRN